MVSACGNEGNPAPNDKDRQLENRPGDEYSPQQDKKQNTTTADQQEPPQQNAPNRTSFFQEEPPKNTSDNYRHQRYERYYWLVTGIASAVATAAAIAAAVFAALAYKAGWQAMIETRRQADAAARPYVFATLTEASNSIHGWVRYEASIDISITVTNFGHGPAILQSVQCSPALESRDIIPKPDIARFLASRETRPYDFSPYTVLGPDKDARTYKCGFGWPLNDSTLAERPEDTITRRRWAEARKEIWVVAIVSYLDVDGGPNETTGCWQYDGFKLRPAGGADCNSIKDAQYEKHYEAPHGASPNSRFPPRCGNFATSDQTACGGA